MAVASTATATATATSTSTATPSGPKRPGIESADGVPVTFTSPDVAMHVYLAKGDVPSGAYPDPFERLPPLPYTVRLAPGTYTVEAQSPRASTGHERIVVESGSPMSVDVRGGDAMVKTFGTIFTAAGIVSTILGVVWIVSIAPSDSHYDRWGVGLPLILAGVGVGGLGIGMTFAGSTNIHAPHLPPGTGVKSVSLAWSF